MSLLTIEHASMVDPAVAPPVSYLGQRMTGDVLGYWPVRQHDRLRRRDPGEPTSRHKAISRTDCLADGHEMAVAGEAHVDALCMPELVEGRIQVQVNAHRDRFSQRFIVQHARDNDE